MSRKGKQDFSHISDSGLRGALEKAWAAFEQSDTQASMASQLEKRKRTEAQQAQVERQHKLRRWGTPLVPSTLIAKGAVEETDAMLAVKEHAAARLLVLAGNPGCGKTVAACTMLESRVVGAFVRAPELSELGTGWTDRQRLAHLRTAGVVVIDDLGVEYRDERMLSRLDELVDRRCSEGLVTVITTNLNADAFELRYEARIWSRIHEHGAYVEIDAPDLRVGHGGDR